MCTVMWWYRGWWCGQRSLSCGRKRLRLRASVCVSKWLTCKLCTTRYFCLQIQIEIYFDWLNINYFFFEGCKIKKGRNHNQNEIAINRTYRLNDLKRLKRLQVKCGCVNHYLINLAFNLNNWGLCESKLLQGCMLHHPLHCIAKR